LKSNKNYLNFSFEKKLTILFISSFIYLFIYLFILFISFLFFFLTKNPPSLPCPSLSWSYTPLLIYSAPAPSLSWPYTPLLIYSAPAPLSVQFFKFLNSSQTRRSVRSIQYLVPVLPSISYTFHSIFSSCFTFYAYTFHSIFISCFTF